MPKGPVVQQPGGGRVITNQPRAADRQGLNILTGLDQLFIKQKLELLEAVTGCETSNQYEVMDSLGQKLMHVDEKTCFCTRQCCGQARPFTIEISSLDGNKFLFLERPLRSASCWCPCCLQVLTVESPRGERIGRVRQQWSCCWPRFIVESEDQGDVLLIKGPLLQCAFCGDVEFQVASLDGVTTIGRISKKWSGILKEMFTDTDNFGVTFPATMDNKLKAVLLGAVILIDFVYFENNEKRPDQA